MSKVIEISAEINALQKQKARIITMRNESKKVFEKIYDDIFLDIDDEIGRLDIKKTMEQIKEAYYTLNQEFLITQPFNTADTRHKTTQALIKLLPFTTRVICDLANNPPDVIDDNIMIARVEYTRRMKFHYVDLTFGNVKINWDEN